MEKYTLNIEFAVDDVDQKIKVMALVGDLLANVYDPKHTFPVTSLKFEVKEDE